MKNNFTANFLRKDLQLEKRWWHRLAKIFFIILTVLIFVGSAFEFYFAEENNARQYKIIKNFADYTEEARNNCLTAKAKLSPDQFSCNLFVILGFLQENTLKDYSLGCLTENNKVDYLSEFSFKEEATCSRGPEYKCSIPQDICSGNASNIVKYDSYVRYGLSNYLSVILKTLGITIIWVLFMSMLYFKGIIYIIFGGKKTTISNE